MSDLDGTMVGEGPDADAATQRFCCYWEDSAALAGSVLVYNTGRSLGQFTGLWAEKGGALALPDVLITAVGTKARRNTPNPKPHTLLATIAMRCCGSGLASQATGGCCVLLGAVLLDAVCSLAPEAVPGCYCCWRVRADLPAGHAREGALGGHGGLAVEGGPAVGAASVPRLGPGPRAAGTGP